MGSHSGTVAGDVGLVEAKLDLPAANETANTRIGEVIGQKGDAVNETASQASIIGLLRAVITTYLKNGTIGLSNLKSLIDAIETKLDTPANFMADVSALALEATLTAIKGSGWTDETLKAIKDAIDALSFGDATEAKQDAIEAKLDLPANFMADVSALALEATLTAIKGTGWTDENLTTIDGLIDDIKAYVDCLPASLGDLVTKNLAHILSDSTAFAGADIATIKGHVDGVETSLGKVALCITQWGGFEDEILLKAAADPAAMAAGTKFTPTLPTNATVWKAYLVMKFREIYCAGANYVATAGSVQVQKSSGGSWVTGITIPTGTLDVAAGASQSGDCLIGNADVSAQVASGSEVEFQLVTLRSNADDLSLRDVQFGLQIYFTI